jgi:hypothetical protein
VEIFIIDSFTRAALCYKNLFSNRLQLTLVEMKQQNSTSFAPLEIINPKAAAYLSNPAKAVFLYPFIGRERSASEVAREYMADLKAYLYQIERMLKLGLLRHTRTKTRKGSPIKYYRAVSDSFFVALNATPLENLENMVDAWSQSLQPLFLSSFVAALEATGQRWGVRISREPNGQLLISPARNATTAHNPLELDAPAVLEGWFTDLRLDHTDAKTLQHELVALYLRYLGRGGAQRYIIRVALAPMTSEDELPPAW